MWSYSFAVAKLVHSCALNCWHAVICDYLIRDAITWKVKVKLGSDCC